MLGQFWRRRQRPFTCADVDARVERLRDGHLPAGGRLPSWEMAAFKAHVTACNTCRQRLETEAGWLAGLQTTPVPARLTPTERRAMQQALGRQMRRGMIMRNIRLSIQQIAVLGVLVLVVGAVVWWQTAVAPVHPGDGEGLDTVVISPTTPSRSITDIAQETIIIRFAVEDHELPVYSSLIAAFEDENPGIKITLISSTEVLGDSFANGDSITIGRLMAESSDVFSNRYAPPYKQEQFIRDLTPFMNTDPGFNSDDFYPNTLQETNGRIYTLPILINFSLIYYNKDIFDAANLAYPQSSWTWNDFRATANALTIHDRDVVMQWGFVKPLLNWTSLFEAQLANPLIDVRTDPPTIRFEDSDVTAVAHQYETLFLVDQAAQAFADVTLIEERKAAMWPGSYRTFDIYSQNQNIGVAIYPVAPTNHNGQPVTLLGVDGFVMSAATRNPDAAWKWMNFLSYQGILTNKATLSARISVAETNKFWQNVQPELEEAMRYALDNSRPFVPNPAYDILDETMNAVLRGEKGIEVAFAQA
ncbi:MAG: extracellular solute-binding protein, partial [Anaerolineae bacterium]|nr:extracellular solute-binding protein [Anaerolineae bacterium]